MCNVEGVEVGIGLWEGEGDEWLDVVEDGIFGALGCGLQALDSCQ